MSSSFPNNKSYTRVNSMPPSTTDITIEDTKQQETTGNVPTRRNIYPFVRHIFIISLVLFTLSILLFLIYHNGKSIYENGL